MWLTCVLTVSSLIRNSTAISLLDRPKVRWRSTTREHAAADVRADAVLRRAHVVPPIGGHAGVTSIEAIEAAEVRLISAATFVETSIVSLRND